MRKLIKNVESVNYGMIVDCIIMSMKIGKEEYGDRKLLRDVVDDLGKFMNKNLDIYRIKDMLKKRGNIIEECVEDGDVMKVKDWVVI